MAEVDQSDMMAENSRITPPSRHEVWRMFDRIAPRYDFLNHFLSLNRDKAWRNKLAALLEPNARVLDLATGTADVLITIARTGKLREGVGLDPSEKMLELGRQKIAGLNLADMIELRNGRAEQITFENASFDAVTIAFGIRNVTEVALSLSEMHRILRENGKALILEFSLPTNMLLRRLYLFYFRKILPRLGGLISGDAHAYRYLNETVETFPFGEDFCALMQTAGFKNVKAHPLTFGVATIYEGTK